MILLSPLKKRWPRCGSAAHCLGWVALGLAHAALATGDGPAQLHFEPLAAWSAAGDGDVHALGDGRWLLARDNGLFLVDGSAPRRLAAGRYESLDARVDVLVDGQLLSLVSMIDAEAGDIQLLLLEDETGEVVATERLPLPDATPEVQCLYRHGDSGNVSLFSVDARGMLEQRYVYSRAAQALVDLPVRRDVGLPEAAGCSVHDASGELFIAEGPVGVWRYAASEESDPTRTPMLLVEPWGVLGDEIEDIAVDDSGVLWVLVPGEGLVHRRAADGALTAMALPADMQATGLSVSASRDGASLVLFDEAQGSARLAAGAARPTGLPAAPGPPPAKATVMASRQTEPVRRYGDAADDPAIFVPEDDHREPLILGTDKREGLAVYSLQGQLLQMLAVGRLNNVDLLTGVAIGGQRRDIVAASNRSNNSISLFDIGLDGVVGHLVDVATSLDAVYGLCMYASPTGAYVFINDKDGRYQQYRLAWDGAAPGGDLVREFRLPSQPEGCVADASTQHLYAGEEDVGIWEAGAEPDGDAPRLIIPTSAALVADVEGMEIYRETPEGGVAGRRLLVVSSQGSDSYAVYDLDADYRRLASFSITANLAAGVDGVSETDGLAVTSTPLPGFPRGVLVVQDGRNRLPDAPQNFKIVDWREIDALLPPRTP